MNLRKGIIVNKKHIVFFSFVVLSTSILAVAYNNKDVSRPKEKTIDQIANQIILELAGNAKKKYDLQLEGSGGGGVYGLNLLKVVFTGSKELFPDEAREVLVDISLQFLHLINSSKVFETRLACFPFSSSNIVVMIGFLKEDCTPPSNSYISFMFLSEGKNCYKIGGGELGRFENAGRETFEEAVAIVANSQNLELSKRAKEYLLSHAK